MAYTTEQMEDAFIAGLESLRTSHGVREIKSYQDELDNAEQIKKTILLTPAIFAVYGGSKYAQHGHRKIERMRFILFFCDRSLRKEEEARRGGTSNPGTYAMIEAARDALCGQVLLADTDPVEILDATPIWSAKGLAIYAATYETAQYHLYPGT